MSQTIYFKYEVGSSEIHGIYYAINTNPFYFTTPSKYIENNSCYIVLIYYLVTHNHIFKFLISSTFYKSSWASQPTRLHAEWKSPILLVQINQQN